MAGRRALLIGLGVTVAVAYGCGGSSDTPRQPADRQGGSPARSQVGGVDPALSARLQETLDSVAERQDIPGASAAVVIPGEGVWTGTTGEADRTRRAVTDRTLFAVGSITKTFVAALMLRLAEDGVLDLEISVNGQLVSIEPDKLDPDYDQADFDSRYVCTPNLVATIPPVPGATGP